jgi:TP901-1 family phage major tail protein
MSNVSAGILHLLQVLDQVSNTYITVGGLQTKKIAFGAAAVDVSNHGSNEWKELLDGHGLRDAKVSGSGVYDDTSGMLTFIQNLFKNQTLWSWQITDTSPNGRTYQGLFKLTSFDIDSTHDKEVKWSLSMESSGEVKLTS